MDIRILLNGRPAVLPIEPDEYLSETLRAAGMLSVRRGCDTGMCGLCTVLVDGTPVLSCSTLSARTDGHTVHTLEGMQEEASEFTKYLTEQGAEQCGFCAPGFILTVLAMKRELQTPTEEAIRRYLNGNLCRCTGYMGQMRAVRRYMGLPEPEVD
ncbi:MAG: 2Fe-2S iron-sulfur cluster binding domain-containing protein [Ruminococcaceae bacterium]|nr:2Fe-2S iron-sulfur cluster binding domain-containing protein [Oscillospiraceae bacterium]